MKIMIVGGGTGGHVMPALSVAKEILKNYPRAKIVFLTDGKNIQNVRKYIERDRLKMEVHRVVSGKFIRYSGWKLRDFFEHFFMFLKDMILKNIWNFFKFVFGIIQNFFLLLPKEKRPDVIFLKGGYTGLPTGIVAKMLKIPYVIHESDSTVGLANRILAKDAKVVAMGMKPKEKTEKNVEFVGIPISDKFRRVSREKQRELKKSMGFSPEDTVVVVTGGSQGSRNLNEAIRGIARELFGFCSVFLVTGKKLYPEMAEMKEVEASGKFRMIDFSFELQEVIGAADIVVSRAGASTIAELATMEKAVILVPYARLPGSHQVSNARNLEELSAVKVVNDEKMQEDPKILLKAIRELALDSEKRIDMASRLKSQIKPNATKRLAEIIVEVFYGNR